MLHFLLQIVKEPVFCICLPRMTCNLKLLAPRKFQTSHKVLNRACEVVRQQQNFGIHLGSYTLQIPPLLAGPLTLPHDTPLKHPDLRTPWKFPQTPPPPPPPTPPKSILGKTLCFKRERRSSMVQRSKKAGQFIANYSLAFVHTYIKQYI